MIKKKRKQDLKRLIQSPQGMFIILITGLMVGSVFFVGPKIYVGGWEVTMSINKTNVNGVIYDFDNQPMNTYSWGTKYVKFDVDDTKQGVPDVSINIPTSANSYVMMGGEWEKARDGEYFKEIPKKIDGDQYFFYHHVFMFDMRIIAEADYVGAYNIGEARDMGSAEAAIVSVFIEFSTPLWKVVETISTEDSVWHKANVWTGVMSAAIVDVDGGYVDELPDKYKGIEGSWSLTNVGGVNMYHVDGRQESDMSLEDAQTDTHRLDGVPSSILLEVAGTSLQPGWWQPFGGSVGVYAVQAEYRLRVDVLTSAKYTFAAGDQDDDLKDAIVSADANKGFLGNLLDDITALFQDPFVVIISLVVFVMVIYVILKIIPAISGVGRVSIHTKK